MYFWYKFFTYLIYPFSTFYLFIRILNKKEDPKRYKEKLSKTDIQRDEGFLIWLHVASVGEAMSILPLIENFENEKNIKKILITTITLSSAQILKKKYDYSKKIVHQFLPLDIPIFVNKFLNYWNPNLAIFIDSEIWPNLIFDIKKKNIPLLLVNGRITKKTFLRWRLIPKVAKKIFQTFDLCLASSNESKNYLEKLKNRDVKIDMIIVDYADLLRPRSTHKEKRIELESIYEELRAVAQEFECPVWTASQTNRSGLNAEVITMESISEAFNKCFVADFIFSVSRTIEDKTANTGRIFVAKNRNGPDGIVYPIFMDTSNVKINVLSQAMSAVEAIEKSDKEKMQDLKERYKKHKKAGRV